MKKLTLGQVPCADTKIRKFSGLQKLLYICVHKNILVCPGTKPHTNKGERMNELLQRIRIKDIARLANVSVGTVDRVLHGRSGISEASRKRAERNPKATRLSA